jgi:hypothetical protein
LDTRQASTSNERAFPVPPRLQDIAPGRIFFRSRRLGDGRQLVDNEEAGIAPVIEISVSLDGIVVADNVLGIAPGTVADILDYSCHVSSREAYVSPTRGAQGNALKTILAMAFVLDGELGETTIESQRAGRLSDQIVGDVL